MTRLRSIAIALLLATACSKGQVDRTRVGARAAAPVALPVEMYAHDATYRVALPAGWRPVVPPMLEYGLVFGTQRESFAMGMDDVYLDPRMLNSILNPGYRAILPPAQFMLKSRLVAPPMGPLEVVTRLLPQIAGGPRGAIQNLRVLRTFPEPQEFGFQQMLVVYEYTFLPQRDPAFASQAHPDLRSQAQVAMQALWSAGWLLILVITAPGDQGAVTTGMQGCGVSTPRAAAVAAATWGLLGVMHIANPMMFTIGMKS